MGALIDKKDSYAYKWHRMREKRTMERVLKDARDEQQQTVLAFRNFSKQFDKYDFSHSMIVIAMMVMINECIIVYI